VQSVFPSGMLLMAGTVLTIHFLTGKKAR